MERDGNHDNNLAEDNLQTRRMAELKDDYIRLDDGNGPYSIRNPKGFLSMHQYRLETDVARPHYKRPEAIVLSVILAIMIVAIPHQ